MSNKTASTYILRGDVSMDAAVSRVGITICFNRLSMAKTRGTMLASAPRLTKTKRQNEKG